MEPQLKTTRPRMILPQPTFYVLDTCPKTGKMVERIEQDAFDIPNGEARWWQCSACSGWHVSVAND